MTARLPLFDVLARIRAAERRFGRSPGSVSLLAVSKTQPAAAVRTAAGAGQTAFGENYVQEAFAKMAALADLDLNWHFIGRIQSNKTRDIASRFAWVHTIDRGKIAERLAAQRPTGLPPLDCCVEVNVSGETTKGGVAPDALGALVAQISALPRLRLRGFMCLPAPSTEMDEQRAAFRKLRELLEAHRRPGMDTLSMGTSSDFEAAIAEGATIVRIGEAVFGPRQCPREVGLASDR